ncbi:MAG: response regulator [Desulfobacterales bacterium]|nr:response regulator [Desulfobacterales bacterium]
MKREIQGQSILVVDDSLTVRMELQALLEEMGLKVMLAEDGRQCMDALQHAKPDAVLLDVVMPEMDGFEVLRWIKHQPELEDIPVIMQTATDDMKSIKRGIDEGAFYYLTKPIGLELLQSIISAAIYDFLQKKALREQILESENPLGSMVEGTFRFRTLADGEYLAVRIANASPSPKKVTVINELIINAIEHGNLGVTYDEKTQYIDNGTWRSEIERRLALPEHAGKDVEVRIKKYPDKMTVLIADHGPGFDFGNYLELDESRALDNHGRGIAIANTYLNLQYHGTGNEVMITIPFY